MPIHCDERKLTMLICIHGFKHVCGNQIVAEIMITICDGLPKNKLHILCRCNLCCKEEDGGNETPLQPSCILSSLWFVCIAGLNMQLRYIEAR